MNMLIRDRIDGREEFISGSWYWGKDLSSSWSWSRTYSWFSWTFSFSWGDTLIESSFMYDDLTWFDEDDWF